MLRITSIPNGQSVVLKLEGELIGPWVAELEQTCAAVEVTARPLELDLAGLSFADRSGARLLAALVARKVALARSSSFLREQIRQHGGELASAAGLKRPDV